MLKLVGASWSHTTLINAVKFRMTSPGTSAEWPTKPETFKETYVTATGFREKTGPGGFVQADVLYMCLFPSYFRFIFPNTPGPPSHPLPVASSLQVGGGEPRGRSERHIGHHVSLGCGSIGFFWGRCYAFIGGKRLGDWWHADVDLDVCFFLGFLWAMRINTLLMI